MRFQVLIVIIAALTIASAVPLKENSKLVVKLEDAKGHSISLVPVKLKVGSNKATSVEDVKKLLNGPIDKESSGEEIVMIHAVPKERENRQHSASSSDMKVQQAEQEELSVPSVGTGASASVYQYPNYDYGNGYMPGYDLLNPFLHVFDRLRLIKRESKPQEEDEDDECDPHPPQQTIRTEESENQGGCCCC